MASIPTEAQLPAGIFTNEEAAYNYLIEKEVIRIPTCASGHPALVMSPKANRDQRFGYYQCSLHKCRKGKSAFKGTFFSYSKLPLHKFLKFMHLWICFARNETLELQLDISHVTVTDWALFLRELVMLDMLGLAEEESKMGGIHAATGERMIVEVDETKLGVRKYNMGHRVEGVWVVGLRERGLRGRFIAVPVPNRKKDTLMAIIEKYVRPDSLVFTDMWKGYCTQTMQQLGMEHRTVNHSQGFKAPDGTHTNTIESMWAKMKARVPVRARTESLVATYLMLFSWRRRFKDVLWDRLLYALRRYTEVHGNLPIANPAEDDADVNFYGEAALDDDEEEEEPIMINMFNVCVIS